jgi:hypothetical protein
MYPNNSNHAPYNFDNFSYTNSDNVFQDFSPAEDLYSEQNLSDLETEVLGLCSIVYGDSIQIIREHED